MKKLLLLSVFIFLGANSSFSQEENTCNEDCMRGLINASLEAMASKDISQLPLADNARYTENGQTLEIGDGMWGAANAVRDYKQYFFDESSQEAAVFTVVEENGHPQIISLRLKLENGKISQVENIVARDTDKWNQPDSLKIQPLFDELVPVSARSSREKMIAITNSYFEGLEKNTDSLTPFAPNVTRIENGNITANNPNGESPIHKMDAAGQFATGFSTFITRIRERRFPIVDEERGLVYAVIFFDHAGTVTGVTLKNGVSFKVPPPFDAPYSFIIGELFKISDGKIQHIEAVIKEVPYGMRSGWVQE